MAENRHNTGDSKPSGFNSSAQKQLRISDIFYALKKHYVLIIICTCIGLVIGIGLSVVSYMKGEMSKQYAITASLAVTSQDSDGLFVSTGKTPGERDIYLAEEMVDSVIYVIRSDKTLNAAIDKMNLIGVTSKNIYDNLEMTQYNETQIIEMTLYWRSAQEGVEILNTIADVSADILIDTLKIGNISLINEPKSKYLIGGSINANVWGYIAVIGMMAGCGIAILDLLLRPTLLEPDDMENVFGLEILAEIPDKKNYFRKKKNPLSDDDDDADGFDITDNYVSLAHILKQRVSRFDNPCIYVTSAAQNEGKTTVTANLAVQYADIGKKVLLIDFDTRNPMLGGMFLEKIEYRHSLNALYRGEITEDEAVTQLTGNLDILPAVLERRPLPLDQAIFDLVRGFQKKYDLIILDTAPVGQVADTMSLNQLADVAIVVVKYDGAKMETIHDSLLRLKKSNMPIIGCVVNSVKNLKNTKGYYGYHGYGGGYGRTKKKNKKSEQQQEWEEWERRHSDKASETIHKDTENYLKNAFDESDRKITGKEKDL